jgi:hypothetical protein
MSEVWREFVHVRPAPELSNKECNQAYRIIQGGDLPKMHFMRPFVVVPLSLLSEILAKLDSKDLIVDVISAEGDFYGE